jgi:hypothetical protein
MAMGADLPRAWSHSAGGNEVRKRILRCVIREIVARIAEARIELVIHWQGGDHTELSVVKNRVGQHRWTTDVEVQTLITQLARQLNDGSNGRPYRDRAPNLQPGFGLKRKPGFLVVGYAAEHFPIPTGALQGYCSGGRIAVPHRSGRDQAVVHGLTSSIVILK